MEICSGDSPHHRPTVGIETAYQLSLTATKIAIAQRMESGGVVHMREVGEFMTYYIVPQFPWQKQAY